LRIYVLDNFDSFTYNLVHYCRSEGAEVRVETNVHPDPEEASGFDRIILSPGPGLPRQSGQLMPFIAALPEDARVLGVCLGLQALVEHFGGKLRNLNRVLHGVSEECRILKPDVLFPFAEPDFMAGHYHSWVADEDSLPHCLEIIAIGTEGIIMALRHRERPIRAVQFHPESVLTPRGREMIAAWLKTGR
jgi:anthranilate synthase component II